MQQNETKKIVDPNKWKPGKYKAKPIDWGVTKDKSGNPRVMVLFEYQQKNDHGQDERSTIMWYGSFNGGARERTMESLMYMGLKTGPSALEAGPEGKALDENNQVEIVIQHRSFEGVVRAEVAWVNALGGRGIESTLAKGEAQSLFAGIDAEYKAMLSRDGQKPAENKTPAQQAMTQGTFSEEDIPF